MSDEPTPRIILPSLLAGPAVILFLIAAYWSSQFTHPIVLPPEFPLILPFILLIASAVGVVPALLANGVGSIIMIKLGTWFPLLRFPLVWGLAGGVLAWAVARRLEGEPEWTFAFTAAGALSALICRTRLA